MSEQKILQASLNLFARYGYDYVSVRQIAKEANVNLGSISYYFENKSGILQRIIEDLYRKLDLVIFPILEDQTLSPRESIQKLTRDTLGVMYDNLDASRITVREISMETERFKQFIQTSNRAMSEGFNTYFARLGYKKPQQAAIKFLALIRFPIGSPNLIENYYRQPFSQELIESYTKIVVSALESEH